MAHFSRRKALSFELEDATRSFIANYAYQPTDAAEKYYKCQLGPLAAFFAGRPLDAITADDIRAYLEHEKKTTFSIIRPDGSRVGGKRQRSQTTIIHRYQGAKTFFNWCVTTKLIAENPMADVRRPKGEVRARRGYTPEEVARMLKAAGTAPGWLRYRDRAILVFMLGTAARAKELLTLEERDIDFRNGRVTLHGKGSKDRTVRLGPNVAKALRQWIEKRPVGARYFWVTHRGTQLTYGALSGMLTNLGEYADVEDCTAHRFRHTAATEYTRQHRDMRATQVYLGHEKPETTARYITRLDADHYINAKYATPDEWLT